MNPGSTGISVARDRQVEAQTPKHTVAFSKGLTFLMERELFLPPEHGWHRFSVIVSMCFVSAEPLCTATLPNTTTNNADEWVL